MLRGSALARHTGPKGARHITFAGSVNSDSDSEEEKEDVVTTTTASAGEEKDDDEESGASQHEELLRFGMIKVDRIYELKSAKVHSNKCHEEEEHKWDEISKESLLGHLTSTDGVSFRLEALRSGLYREQFVIHCSVCDMERHVVIEAKIMGSNKGTPSLRDGVHCVGLRSGVEHADDSDNDSDDNSDDEKQ